MAWPLVVIIGASAIAYLIIKSRQHEKDLAEWIKDQEEKQCEQAVEDVKDYLATTRPFE
jgi:hypothetical protein